MAIISEFYKRLRDLCEERSITVNELVKILDLSSGSPTAWKNGTVPRYSTAVKIAEHFGVSTDYLLGKESKNAPAGDGKRAVSNDELMFALWGDCQDIDEDDIEDVKRYAAFLRERKNGKK